MKLTGLLFIPIVCLILSGCQTTRTTYDYDRDFDFSRLQHYQWLATPKDFPASEIVIQRIQKAVDGQMEIKGFSKTSGSPDFFVSMQAFRDIVRQGYTRGTSYRDYRGYNRAYEKRYDVYEYEEGTLTVTVINAAGNNLVWEGSATGTIEPHLSVERKEKRTQELVARLLADFPPVSKAPSNP